MGGYVARMTFHFYPHLRPYLQNMITLATPHGNPLYAMDGSVHEFHQYLLQDDDHPLIVSISGGLRDDMILPSACHVVDGNSQSTLDSSYTVRTSP